MRWMPAESSTVGSWAKAVAAATTPAQTPIFKPSCLIRRNKKGRAGGPALFHPSAKLLFHFVLLFVLLLRGLLTLFVGFLVALLHLFLLVRLGGAGMGHRQSRAARNSEHSGHQDGDQLPHIFLSVELTIGLRPVLCFGTSPSPLTPFALRG